MATEGVHGNAPAEECASQKFVCIAYDLNVGKSVRCIMGCSGSRVTVVQPLDPNGTAEVNNEGDVDAAVLAAARGDSAVSKHTTDSGLGLEAGDPNVAIPGALSGVLPPVRASRDGSRLTSQEILNQLLSQGLIPAHPRQGGEAYSVMMNGLEKPLRRPPPRLESLKTQKEKMLTKEDIEDRMKRVEERRRAKEAALKQKLRTKSAHRPAQVEEEAQRDSVKPQVGAVKSSSDTEGECDDDEETLVTPFETDAAFQQTPPAAQEECFTP